MDKGGAGSEYINQYKAINLQYQMYAAKSRLFFLSVKKILKDRWKKFKEIFGVKKGGA